MWRHFLCLLAAARGALFSDAWGRRSGRCCGCLLCVSRALLLLFLLLPWEENKPCFAFLCARAWIWAWWVGSCLVDRADSRRRRQQTKKHCRRLRLRPKQLSRAHDDAPAKKQEPRARFLPRCGAGPRVHLQRSTDLWRACENFTPPPPPTRANTGARRQITTPSRHASAALMSLAQPDDGASSLPPPGVCSRASCSG